MLPTSPEGWAIHLSKLLRVFHEAHSLDRFPVNVSEIAIEYSQQVFPNEPITLVQGKNFSYKFEGMLAPNPSKNEWGIFYNDAIRSKGRQNFTLAHELGHYLLHRHLSPNGIKCSSRDMSDWQSNYAKIESQANTFSSYLLMPLDDFREQSKDQSPTIELMSHLANRYNVSITAVILKWLGITSDRAMIVVGKEGFIDWAWSSKNLLRSGVYFKGRQETIELPINSLAAKQNLSYDNNLGIQHPKGVWNDNEEVFEMTIFSEINEMTISLLIFSNNTNYITQEEHEDDGIDDAVTRIST